VRHGQPLRSRYLEELGNLRDELVAACRIAIADESEQLGDLLTPEFGRSAGKPAHLAIAFL
jgi:hypothetical protein